ncbi:transposase [Pseudarthrobacter albicanus]|uniref:transposase n=1 Tax=Pseudarthrobacter albicanus TaxID=2823873 RepID=UPI0035587ADB
MRRSTARRLHGGVRATLNAVHLGLSIYECESTLTALDGLGDILAARILARIGNPGFFGTAAALADYAGAAPVEVGRRRPRGPQVVPLRRAAAQLCAPHRVQIRVPGSTGYAYYRQ